VAALLWLAALLVIAPLAAIAGDRVDFDIAAQRADRGLIEFARQAGRSVLIPTERISQFTTRAVHGSHSVEEALGMLLDNSGLSGELIDGGVVTVKINRPVEDKQTQQATSHGWLASALSGTASAQTTGVVGDSGKLEEIIVTAERRATDLQKTPISIVALDETALAQKGIENLGELARATPSLSSSSDIEGMRPVFFIRGIGNASGRETQEAGVALYVDDIYLPRSNGAYLQLVDVDHVEVLRGPQGTLFGRNASGGAIRYLTKKPTHDFEASASATVGSASKQDLTTLLNIPLGDRLAARVQFGSFQQNGYMNYTQTNVKGGAVDDIVSRGVLRFNATDRLTVDVGTTFMKSKRARPAVKVVSNNIVDPQAQALSAHLVQLGQPALTVNDPRFVYADKYTSSGACYMGSNTLGMTNPNGTTRFNDVENYCRDNQDQTTQVSFADINWAFTDVFSARALTGYVDGLTNSVADGGGIGVQRNDDTARYHSFSQELQLKMSTQHLDAVGGLYYFREGTNRLIYGEQLSPPSLGTTNLGQCCDSGSKTHPQTATETKGIFGQITLSLTERLQAILGARYSSDHKNIAVARTNLPLANPALGLFPGEAFSNNATWSHADYRGSVLYQFTNDLMAYVTVSTGYKAGGFNDSLASGLAEAGGLYAYAPEKVVNYEAGFKTQWFDDHLRFNLTGFRMDYTDLQLSSPVIDQLTNATVVITQNAGKVQLSGIEGELAWRVTDGLTLSVSGSTLHQNVKSLPDGNGLFIPSTCSNPAARGAATSAVLLRTFATCQIQDLAGAPKYQYTAGADYALNAFGGKLNLGASYAYTAQKYSLNSAAASFLIPAYGTLNVHINYAPENARWNVSLYGTNVTNEYYYITGQNGVGSFGTVTASPGRPAEYGVSVKTKF